MSAIEHPAARSGRITRCSGAVSTSALSAMKCTPQNTTVSAARCAAANCDSLSESPIAVGELDHFVALVVMAENDEPVAERGFGGRDADVELGLRQTEIALRQRLALAQSRALVVGQQLYVHLHSGGYARGPFRAHSRGPASPAPFARLASLARPTRRTPFTRLSL